MVTDNRNRSRSRAGGGSPGGGRASLFGRPGQGRRGAAVAVVAAGAAALGAVLAVPAGSGPGSAGLVATADAVFADGGPAGSAAPGNAASPAVPKLAWTA